MLNGFLSGESGISWKSWSDPIHLSEDNQLVWVCMICKDELEATFFMNYILQLSKVVTIM